MSHQNLIVRLTIAVLVALALLLAFGSRLTTTALLGNTPNALTHSQLILSSPQAQTPETMHVVVGFKLRNEGELDTLLLLQSDVNSPMFRQDLAPGEGTSRYWPSEDDYQSVVKYLGSHGLTVTTHSNRMLISVDGTRKQMEAAFNVTINKYSILNKGCNSCEKTEFWCNTSDPRLPNAIAPLISSVSGLNTLSRYHPNHTGMVHDLLQPSANATKSAPSARLLTPQKIATVYEFPSPLNKKGSLKYTGKKVTIGIITAHPYLKSDVETYWKEFGITRTGNISEVNVRGKSKHSDESSETTLDLEQVGAHAPDADIRLYIGSSSSFGTFEEVYNKAITDNPDIISISWGLCEEESGTAHSTTEHNLLKLAAAQGIAVFVASGDNGAYDCEDEEDPAVNFPSSTELVVAVGGTTLRLNSDFSRQSETGWRGSGGGTSSMWPQPTWQKVKGVPQSGKRESPDIAGASDPLTGHAMYFQGRWTSSGGTSFAAPFLAAYWAQVQEAVGHRVRDVNTVLYHIATATDKKGNLLYPDVFYDVTKGANKGKHHKKPGLLAGPGWDHVTGWGCVRGINLLNAVKLYGKKP